MLKLTVRGKGFSDTSLVPVAICASRRQVLQLQQPRQGVRPQFLPMGDPQRDMRWIFAGANKVTGAYGESEYFSWQGVTVEMKTRAAKVLELIPRVSCWQPGVSASAQLGRSRLVEVSRFSGT